MLQHSIAKKSPDNWMIFCTVCNNLHFIHLCQYRWKAVNSKQETGYLSVCSLLHNFDRPYVRSKLNFEVTRKCSHHQLFSCLSRCAIDIWIGIFRRLLARPRGQQTAFFPPRNFRLVNCKFSDVLGCSKVCIFDGLNHLGATKLTITKSWWFSLFLKALFTKKLTFVPCLE